MGLQCSIRPFNRKYLPHRNQAANLERTPIFMENSAEFFMEIFMKSSCNQQRNGSFSSAKKCTIQPTQLAALSVKRKLKKTSIVYTFHNS